MKIAIAMLGILAAIAVTGTRAEAQNYPWCADYGGSMGGASNCGFVSFAQCMQTLAGNGGFCNVNTQYVPPAGASRSSHRVPKS
jgi:hypothetical protein